MSDLPTIAATVIQPNPFSAPAGVVPATAPPPTPAATPGPKFLANSADEFFGPAPKYLAGSADEFFGQAPEPGMRERLTSFLTSHLLPDPASLIGGEPLKMPKPGEPHPSVISPIIDAAVRGFGPERIGISPETEQWLKDAGLFNDWQKEDHSIWRTLNEAAVRAAGVPIDTLMRAGAAGFAASQEFVNQSLGGGQFARDIAALPEAFQGSPHQFATPEAPAPSVLPDLAEARPADLRGAQATAVERLQPTGAPTPTERVRVPAEAAPVEAPPVEAPSVEAPSVEAPAPDVHAVARQIEPKLFSDYDALAARKNTLQGFIDDLSAQRERGLSPDIAALDEQIDKLREERLSVPSRERAGLANQITELEGRRAKLADDLPAAGDTPEMARVRRDLQETDYQMRDMAPDVSAAYRRAAAGEAPPTSGGNLEAPAAEIPPPRVSERPDSAALQSLNDRIESEDARWRGGAEFDTTPGPREAYREAMETVPEDVRSQYIAHGIDSTRGGNRAQALAGMLEERAGSLNAGPVLPTAEQSSTGLLGTRTRAPYILLFKADKPLFDGAAFVVINTRDLGIVAHAKALFPGERVGSPSEIAGWMRDPASAPERVAARPSLPEAVFVPPEAVPSPVAAAPAGAAATPPIEGGIAGDMAKQLIAAGQPEDVARATAAIVQARYEARAANLRGATAEGLYREDGARVARGRQRVKEMAQPAVLRDLEQTRRGKIRLGDPAQNARSIITIFRDGDASTAIHEFGHDWLEQMRRDSIDPRASDQLKADNRAIHEYLGIRESEPVPTKAHEKFARSFERYMMEGHAPSAALAHVFQQFKQWLTDIYRTATRLRAPITDDIRAVFDRMLATPDSHPVIAPEIEHGKSFADIHEADLAETPPEHAAAVADTIEAERDHLVANAPPEVQSGRPDRRPRAEDRGSQPRDIPLDRQGDAGRSEPGAPGSGAEPGAIGEGGNQAPPEGSGVAARPSGAGPATAIPGSPNASFERAPESGVTDKAGNIRLELLNTPDDVNTILRQTAAENNGFMTERRGVLSDNEVEQLSDALGMDPKRLNRRRIGQAFSAEEILAARKLLIQSATNVRDAMRKAATGSDVDVLAYAEAKTKHLMIQGQVAGITAEAGRALRAFRELQGSREAKTLGQFLLKKATGKDLFQLREEAQLGLSLNTPRELSQFVHDSVKPRLIDKILEVWMNALLSGYQTHATNMISNAIVSLYSVPETAVAAAVGRVRQLLPNASAERVFVGEARTRLFGIIEGAPEGVRAGWELLKNEDLADLNSKTEMRRGPAIEGVKGKIIRIPGRLLGAEDKVFKGIAYRQELNTLIYRQAIQEGLKGDKLAARITELKNDPPEAMIEAATEHADYQTFNNALGPGMAALQRITGLHPTLKFVIPFVRTPTNILKYSVERSPLGFAMREVRENMSGKNGAIARDTQIARMALGTAVAGTAAWFATQGLITGGGPSDTSHKSALRLTGWQPYSVKIGNHLLSFARMEPLGTILGIAADASEISQVLTSDEHENIAALVFASIAKNLTSKTFLKGPSDLIQAITDPERHGENYIKAMAGTVVPSIVAQTTHATDPYLREARGIIDNIKYRTPGLSQTLYPSRDVWGEPIRSPEAVGPLNLTGIAESKINNDPVNKALIDVGYFPAKLEHKIDNTELSGAQYDEYAKIAGKAARMRVEALVNRPDFQAWPIGIQHDNVKSAVDQSRDLARRIMRLKYQEIPEKARAAKIEHLTGVK